MSVAPKLELIPTPSKAPRLRAVKKPEPRKIFHEYDPAFVDEAVLSAAVGKIATTYLGNRRKAIDRDVAKRATLKGEALKNYKGFDRSQEAVQRTVVGRTFQELGMLDKSKAALVKFDAEYRNVAAALGDEQTITRAAATESVEQYFEHPSLKLARMMVGATAEFKYFKDDALAAQRIMAQLLEADGTEPAPIQD